MLDHSVCVEEQGPDHHLRRRSVQLAVKDRLTVMRARILFLHVRIISSLLAFRAMQESKFVHIPQAALDDLGMTTRWDTQPG